jgi:hypothetical protein
VVSLFLKHAPYFTVECEGRVVNSLGGLGQEAYQVLSEHGRLETGEGRSEGCHSRCTLVGREE